VSRRVKGKMVVVLLRKPRGQITTNNWTRQSHVKCVYPNVTSNLLFFRFAFRMGSVPWTAASHESLIGPPSEPIHIDDFLSSIRDSAAFGFTPSNGVAESVDPVTQDPVASECR
jgi:hypothetical protein